MSIPPETNIPLVKGKNYFKLEMERRARERKLQPREPEERIVHKPVIKTNQVDSKQTLQENPDILEKYHEKKPVSQELTIIEIRDPRESVEPEEKELVKKEKEIIDTTDLPKDEDLIGLIEQMDLQETHGEADKVEETTNPVKMEIEEENVQKNEDHKGQAEELMDTEEELPKGVDELVELHEGLSYDFPVSKFITSSNTEVKTGTDLKYMRMRFVFKPDISLYIDCETHLTGKEIKVDEEVGGVLRSVTKQKVYANSEYRIREWNGKTHRYKDLQEDVEYVRRNRPIGERYVPTGSSPKVNLYKQVDFAKTHFRLEVTNTIFTKEVAEAEEEEVDPMNAYNVARYIYNKYQDKANDKPELEEWLYIEDTFKGYYPYDQQLMKAIQETGEPAIRADGTPYTTTEQYLEDYEITIEQLRGIFTNYWKEGNITTGRYQEVMEIMNNYIFDKENEKQLTQFYLDMMVNDTSKLSKMRRELASLEYSMQGEKNNITKPSLRIEVMLYQEGKKDTEDSYANVRVAIIVHCESMEQHRKLEQLFEKELVAIIVRTSEYPPSTLVEQRKKELAEWKAKQAKEE